MAQPVRTMSGGQRRRVELARILFAETEILLLDEPTNHLDLDAKAWMVGFLSEYRGALLVVSHDLPLLDASITSVLALENGMLEPYRGTYSFYLEEKERRRFQRVRENTVRERQIAQLEATARRFMGTTEKMSKRAHGMQTRRQDEGASGGGCGAQPSGEPAVPATRTFGTDPPSKGSDSPRRSMTTWSSSTSMSSWNAGSDSSSWASTVQARRHCCASWRGGDR